jgi:hypothetical protein
MGTHETVVLSININVACLRVYIRHKNSPPYSTVPHDTHPRVYAFSRRAKRSASNRQLHSATTLQSAVNRTRVLSYDSPALPYCNTRSSFPSYDYVLKQADLELTRSFAETITHHTENRIVCCTQGCTQMDVT